MQKITIHLFVTGVIFIAGLQFLVPVCSYAERHDKQAAYYTIQTGTYISEEAAERNYQNLLRKLNENQLQQLRIEKIKKYYVVRIGRYDNKDEADRFYQVLKAKLVDAPLVTKSRVGPEVLVKEYTVKDTRKAASEKKHFPEVAALVPVESRKEGVPVPPTASEKKKRTASQKTVKKDQTASPPLARRERKEASPVFSKPQQAQCVARPVLILADVSGSMLDNAKVVESQTADESNSTEFLKKVEVEKQLLEQISPQLAASMIDFGIYQFRFFPRKQSLYDPLLRIDSHEITEVEQRVKNYFKTEYQSYNQRSPITDLLQQLDADIFWKIPGGLTILLISDAIVINNGLQKATSEDLQNQYRETKILLAEVRRLKIKYGQLFTIHTLHIESREDENPELTNGYGLLLKNVASAGGGRYFAGMAMLQDEKLISELSSALSCTSK